MRLSLPWFCAPWPGAFLAHIGIFASLVATGLVSAPAAFALSLPAASAPARSESKDTVPSDSEIEAQLQQLLVGKPLYLRGGYLDNNLSFNEYGGLIGHSPRGSFTLNLIRIDKVHLERHKLRLEGIRYGVRFLDDTYSEDPSKAMERVRITPKKKVVRISIDREQVVKAKRRRSGDEFVSSDEEQAETASTPSETPAASPGQDLSAPPQVPTGDGTLATASSPAHALQQLRDAVGNVFSIGLDDRMIAAMPDFWKLYYQAIKAHANYRPSEPGVFFEGNVDQKAKLLSNLEAPSNEYAQTGGIGGVALYHAVVGTDGRPEQIVVSRPIGFGLDENAVDTIRKAEFQPAMKDGKPVPVMLDLVVEFRIFSKRTSVDAPAVAASQSGAVLPGPYSVNHP